MQPRQRSIIDLFDGKRRYIVPLFQRQYVWSRDDEWEPLWDDLERKFLLSIETGSIGNPHFLGAIVIDQKRVFGDSVPTHLVIDGQQRLTTFQIFLAAFRDLAHEMGEKAYAEECRQYLENTGMMQDEKTEKYKLWPTQVDRAQFSNLIDAGSKAEVEARFPLTRRKYARKPDPRPRMVEGYLFFYDELEELFRAEDLPGNITERFRSVYQTLRSGLQIVSIELEDQDDPQIIFETLNARGQPLLPSDLLRNYIFLRANQEDENVEHLYQEYWLPFDDEFWKKDERQGRLMRPRTDLFLQHYLTLKRMAEVPTSHIYGEYRNWIENISPFEGVKDELEELAQHREFYRSLISPLDGTPLGRVAHFLRVSDSTTAYPLILGILDRELSEEEEIGIFIILESYLIRRSVCGLTTKNYNRVFMQVLNKLPKNDLTSDTFADILSKLEGDSAVWPRDPVFREAWLNKPIYETLESKRIVWILSSIEENIRASKSERIKIESNLSLEHVLPQKWVDDWPLPNGERGATFEEIEDQSRTVEVVEQTRKRDVLKHSIGNLTLVTSPLNSSLSNASYDRKKPEIIKYSGLALNRYFQDREDWQEESIIERASLLFDIALSIWPAPVTSGK